MSRIAYLGRRVLRLLATVWAAFTLAFAYVELAPFARAGVDYSHVAATAGDPLVVRYAHWLAWFLTIPDEPVMATVLTHLSYTAVYLVPSMAFAIVAGIGLRVYSVGREGRRFDVGVSAVTLVAVSVPVFLVALALRTTLLNAFFRALGTVRIYDRSAGALARRNLVAAVWPTAAMALYLVAVQSRYAGDVLRDYVGSDFVKTARAKGAGPWRVGRHVFRTTAVPLVTVFFTDMLGPVLVGVFAVEHVVGTPGFGDLMVRAVFGWDLPLVLSLVVLVVVTGVLANFLQDVAYLVSDPRVEFET